MNAEDSFGSSAQRKPQISPLRFASVEMTKGRVVYGPEQRSRVTHLYSQQRVFVEPPCLFKLR
jgi:hypothetical protein